ncbi:MAG: bifunctional UDP-N-acetylglucosamine diphosphorylase/glucosamine-1-phosphate N-acetyltransferase GlmU [Dehalococcoidia bacterium]
MTSRAPGATPLSSPKTTAVTSLAGWAALVLAPGDSLRMQSATPAVLHPVAGVPMVRLVCDLLREAGCPRIVIVAGMPRAALADIVGDGVEVVDARDAEDPANAALRARAAAGDHDRVLILRADMPLISTRTLRELAGRHLGESRVLTFLTAYLTDPHGFGRILRRNGEVRGIIRERDLTGAMRGQPEVNAGLYAADARWLWETLAALRPNSSTDSLGDLVAHAVARGGVEAYQVTEAIEVAQVGDRVQLAQADRILRDRIRERLMRDGVTLMDPPSIYIDAGVEIAGDTVILPGTHVTGVTRIGGGCRIGPNAILRDMLIGERCEIGGSTLEGSTIGDGVTVGPYCHVRPGSTIERDVHLGNYAEVKASRIGERTAVGHFSYIGDADVGADVNVGAGSITANYDGQLKHRTVIGDGVHLGSDTVMVAPVTLGRGARTGAGAVVVDDVAEGATVLGVPARPLPRGTGAGEGGHPA